MWPFKRARKESTDSAQRERVEKLERNVTESLRTFAAMLTQVANLIERRRLMRSGYAQTDRFLERSDKVPSPEDRRK